MLILQNRVGKEEVPGTFFRVFCFVLSHYQWCPRVISGSALRNHSSWVQGEKRVAGERTLLATCKASTLYYISSAPLQPFFFYDFLGGGGRSDSNKKKWVPWVVHRLGCMFWLLGNHASVQMREVRTHEQRALTPPYSKRQGIEYIFFPSSFVSLFSYTLHSFPLKMFCL